jgi:hypothetical protein
MNQGPIIEFKKIYRFQLIKDILASNLSVIDFQKSVVSNIKAVIEKCSNIWNKEIDSNTLMSSWNRLGLNKDKKLEIQNHDFNILRLYKERFNLSFMNLNLEDWLSSENDDGPGYSILTDQEIVEEVQRLNTDQNEQNTLESGRESFVSALNSPDPCLIEWDENNANFQETPNYQPDILEKSTEETIFSNLEVIQNCELLIKWVETRIDSQQISKNIKEQLINLIEIAKNKNCN